MKIGHGWIGFLIFIFCASLSANSLNFNNTIHDEFCLEASFLIIRANNKSIEEIISFKQKTKLCIFSHTQELIIITDSEEVSVSLLTVKWPGFKITDGNIIEIIDLF